MYVALFCATILAAFIVPFLVPPGTEAYGQSYVVGFNNRLAIFLLVGISLAVVWLQRGENKVARSAAAPEEPRLGLTWLASAWLLVTLWIVPLAKMILAHTSRSVEDFTFIPQLQKAFYFHRALYTQVEFAYGPLLFYPTLWLAHLCRFYNDPVNLAYYVTLLLHHVAGLALLFYTVNRLPLRHNTRAALFLLVGAYSLNPLMGLNYTLLRFMAPLAFAVLIAGRRSERQAVALSFFCTVFAFSLSAEMGVALAAGVCLLALWRMLRGNRRALLVAVAGIAGALLTAAFLPAEYFYSLRGFSRGYNNIALFPRPDILLTLLCLTCLAPIVAGRALWRKESSTSTDRVWIVYAVALAMVPAALGPSESMHNMSNGVGLFLLGGVCVSRRRTPAIAFFALLFGSQVEMLHHHMLIAKGRLLMAARCSIPADRLTAAEHFPPPVRGLARTALTITCPAYIAADDLNSTIHGEPFVIPWFTDANVSERIVRMPNYQPSYFHGIINVWSREQQQRKIDEMRNVRWAIVLHSTEAEQEPSNVPTEIGGATHFHARHTVYLDDLITAELNRNWQPVRQVSEGTWLYRRIH